MVELQPLRQLVLVAVLVLLPVDLPVLDDFLVVPDANVLVDPVFPPRLDK